MIDESNDSLKSINKNKPLTTYLVSFYFTFHQIKSFLKLYFSDDYNSIRIIFRRNIK